MTIEITTIKLPMPLNITNVNCYLLKNDNGFFLVDSGMTNNRKKLTTELERLGCRGGMLKLILLTHGDFDHTGTAIYLRSLFRSKIAMHRGDVGMLETGDMFWNRKFKNKWLKAAMKTVMPFKAQNRGKPDLLLEDGASLLDYGLEAAVYNTPGHSTGSVCFLTSAGDLFAGDLLTNSTGKPMLNSMLYDKPEGYASLERLKTLPIQMVYPGHGKPFTWSALFEGKS